jgi:hypothetical protein
VAFLVSPLPHCTLTVNVAERYATDTIERGGEVVVIGEIPLFFNVFKRGRSYLVICPHSIMIYTIDIITYGDTI